MKILFSILFLVIGIVSCGSPSRQTDEPAVPERKEKADVLRDKLSAVKSNDSLLYNRLTAECDSSLGDLAIHKFNDEEREKGTQMLIIAHQTHSGDGTFTLLKIESNDSVTTHYSYTGKRYTLRGMPGNADATIWQCRVDSNLQFNYYCVDDTTLIALDSEGRLTEDTFRLGKNW